MTAVLSVAVKLDIGTVRLVEIVGIVKDVTVGAEVSGKVIVIGAETLVDILPSESLVKA